MYNLVKVPHRWIGMPTLMQGRVERSDLNRIGIQTLMQGQVRFKQICIMIFHIKFGADISIFNILKNIQLNTNSVVDLQAGSLK